MDVLQLLTIFVISVNQKYFKMCPRKQKSYNEPPLQAKEQYCSYPYKALNNYSMYASKIQEIRR
ncbi:hypothetical protein ZEAMMB73_Zm00001d014567 [Zea mays]|uniref:Uncharacterized protein n=2 Tax=Zea mays TaxID=4577 RepID=A0A1D6GU56_MAIZE|nr:hypothetical protein ZEAMMB73_Zm00001d014567 [Zea mays]